MYFSVFLHCLIYLLITFFVNVALQKGSSSLALVLPRSPCAAKDMYAGSAADFFGVGKKHPLILDCLGHGSPWPFRGQCAVELCGYCRATFRR